MRNLLVILCKITNLLSMLGIHTSLSRSRNIIYQCLLVVVKSAQYHILLTFSEFRFWNIRKNSLKSKPAKCLHVTVRAGTGCYMLGTLCTIQSDQAHKKLILNISTCSTSCNQCMFSKKKIFIYCTRPWNTDIFHSDYSHPQFCRCWLVVFSISFSIQLSLSFR